MIGLYKLAYLIIELNVITSSNQINKIPIIHQYSATLLADFLLITDIYYIKNVH